MDKRSIIPILITPAAIILGAVIIAGGIIWSNKDSRIYGADSQAQQQLPPEPTKIDATKISMEGAPYIGRADAPLTIAYWYDYQCPFCRQNEEQSMPSLIKDYVDTGKARIVFKDLQFLGPDSRSLGLVSRAVWELAPGKFYGWHKAVFDGQGTENSGWATKEKVLAISSQALGADLARKAVALADSKAASYDKAMDADKAEAAQIGITSTPSYAVGEKLIVGALPYASIRASIELELKDK